MPTPSLRTLVPPALSLTNEHRGELPVSVLDLPLIEVAIKYRPLARLQQRAMSGKFLNETTVSDIMSDPSRTAFLLRMEPAIGPKSREQIIAAVHNALDSALGEGWFFFSEEPDADATQNAAALHARLQEFSGHWPRPDAGETVGEQPLVKQSDVGRCSRASTPPSPRSAR